MTNIILPRENQTGVNEWSDVEANDKAIQAVVNGELDTANLKAAAGITRAQLAAEAKAFTWYTPKVIATEETRSSTSFGTLTTADSIAGVVMPENGLMAIGYSGFMKSSVASAGRVAIFLGANQLKKVVNSEFQVQEVSTNGTGFGYVTTMDEGLFRTGETHASPLPTTGVVLGAQSYGGMTYVQAAAGTYTISIQYKATSGTVTAKERKLWVVTMG